LVEEIQKQISKSAQKEQDLFDSGALVLVGINRFQDYDAPKTKSTRIDKTYNDKMLIEPIRGIRLSEKTEQHNGK
jgi:methylmalonyl-CoA mutase